MYEDIINRMRRLVMEQLYILTVHAADEMEADNLLIYDLERIVLTGSIVERQLDSAFSQYKYKIRGLTVDGSKAELVARLSPTGKVVFVTVYSLGG